MGSQRGGGRSYERERAPENGTKHKQNGFTAGSNRCEQEEAVGNESQESRKDREREIDCQRCPTIPKS